MVREKTDDFQANSILSHAHDNSYVIFKHDTPDLLTLFRQFPHESTSFQVPDLRQAVRRATDYTGIIKL